MGDFQKGDRVRWESQSGGVRSEKVGRVVKVVPAGERPAKHRDWRRTLRLLRDLGIDPSRYKIKKLGGGMARGHESYLVAVDSGKTDRAKPWLYWPRVSNLQPADKDHA